MKENINQTDRLVELHGSGYKIAKDEPDIRGWEVKDIQGRIYGRVDELLFDKESEKVRYLVIDLKGNSLHLENRKIVIPIGLAELHGANHDVVLPEITAIHLTELPGYERGRLTYDEEKAVRRTLAGLGGGVLGVIQGEDFDSDDRSKFYEHEHFSERKFYQTNTPAENINEEGNRENFEVSEQTTKEQHASVGDTFRKTDMKTEQTKPDDRSKGDGHQGLIGEHDLA